MDSNLEVRPTDIKRLDHKFFLSNPRYLFYDLFGGIGYAKVVEVLLKESQERGEWTSLIPHIFDLPDYENSRDARRKLDKMFEETTFLATKGLINTDTGRKYWLTQTAIEILFEKYPSENRAN